MSFHVFCSSLRTQLTVLDIRVIVLLANFIGLVRVSFIFPSDTWLPNLKQSLCSCSWITWHSLTWRGISWKRWGYVLFVLAGKTVEKPYHTLSYYIYMYIYIYLYTAPRNIGNELFIVHPNYELWHPKNMSNPASWHHVFFYDLCMIHWNLSVLLTSPKHICSIGQNPGLVKAPPSDTAGHDDGRWSANAWGAAVRVLGKFGTLLNTMDTTDKDE